MTLSLKIRHFNKPLIYRAQPKNNFDLLCLKKILKIILTVIKKDPTSSFPPKYNFHYGIWCNLKPNSLLVENYEDNT